MTSAQSATLAFAAALLLAGPAAPARAAEAGTAERPSRVRLWLGAGSGSSLAFESTRSFTEYAEEGSLAVSYDAPAGFWPEGGFEVRAVGPVAIGLVYEYATVDADATWQASLPHPLYFERPRSVEGELAGLPIRRGAAHVRLSLGRWTGALTAAVFAGASFYRVEADLIEAVPYTQSYPYDSVSAGAPVRATVEDSPVGFHAGARVDYRLGRSRSFGFGGELRYAQAKAELALAEGGAVEVDLGGLRGAAGISIYF